jgi:ABC-type lipoprotein release transport system permease subunit
MKPLCGFGTADAPFGVRLLDATTLAAAAGIVLAVALIASYVPARRAASVDPLEALRVE